MLERIRGKELVLDQNANEMRQLKSTLKSQETSIAYFKRQIQDLEQQLDSAKSEKQTLKREITLARQENERVIAEQPATVGQSSIGNAASSSNGGDTSGFDNFKMLLSSASATIGQPAEEGKTAENGDSAESKLDE